MNYFEHFGKNQIPGGVDWVVGDIHGYYSRLMDALDAVGFNKFRDRLFSVGDLVDRGPESALVVSLLQEPWFFAIRGNHEDMAIRWMNRVNGQASMPIEDWPMDAWSYARNGGQWFIDLHETEQTVIANSLKRLPYAIELETSEGLLGIIHAEVINDDWEMMKEFFASREPGRHTKKFKLAEEMALWERSKISGDRNHGPVAGVTAVVCGHTPLKEVRKIDNQIYIDTMGWRPEKGGQFTIMPVTHVIKMVRDVTPLNWE